MELEELLEYLSEGKTLTAGTEAFDCMHRWSLETQSIVAGQSRPKLTRQ